MTHLFGSSYFMKYDVKKQKTIQKKLTDIITRSMAAIMDTEINDTIRTNSGY